MRIHMMSEKLFSLFFIYHCLLLGNLSAQDPYFLIKIPSGTGATKVIDLSKKYEDIIWISVGSNVKDNSGRHNILVRLNSEGAVMDSIRMQIDSVFLFIENMKWQEDGSLLMIGTWVDNRLEQTTNIMTCTYDFKKDTVIYNTRFLSYYYNIREVVEKRGGGFGAIGQTNMNGHAQIVFYEFDVDGNLILERGYGSPHWQDGWSIVEHPAGGYVLGGWKARGGSGFFDHYVIRINYSGDVIWERVITGQYTYGVCYLGLQADGNIIVTSARHKPNSFMFDSYAFELRAQDGQVVWENRYPREFNNQFFYDPIVLNDGSTIASDTRRVLHSQTTQQINCIGLSKIARGGDLIWDRTYILEQDQFHILGTSPQMDEEGYFWLGGRVNTSAFLMRVDSVGCPIPDCDDVYVSTEEAKEEIGVTIAPNPFKEVLQVRYVLPSGGRSMEIAVLDLQGRPIYRGTLMDMAAGGDVFIYTSSWPMGVYLVQIWVDGKLVKVEKVVRGG